MGLTQTRFAKSVERILIGVKSADVILKILS